MNRPKCAECGKSLDYETKAHPGIGIARQYLKAPARNLDHVGPLLDSLEESGHAGLHRYVSAALAHHQAGGSSSPLRLAVRDVIARLGQPGTAAPLRWKHPRGPNRPDVVLRAAAGHGHYETRRSPLEQEIHYIPLGGQHTNSVLVSARRGAQAIPFYRTATQHHLDTLAGYESEE